MQQYQPRVIIEQQSNGLGIAGLIFSCLGWLTCGVLCIPGVVLSIIGLGKQPNGTAIAGIIVGAPGVIGMILAIVIFFGGMLGMEAAYHEARRIQAEQEASQVQRDQPVGQPSNISE